MRAGLTEHVWSLKEVLLVRVPPWPQPQMVSKRALIDNRGVAQLLCMQGRPRGGREVLKTQGESG
jgi:hypothetical protein